MHSSGTVSYAPPKLIAQFVSDVQSDMPGEAERTSVSTDTPRSSSSGK